MTDPEAPQQAGRPTSISRDPIGTDPIGNNPLELNSPPQKRTDGDNATPGGWLKNATGVFIAVIVLVVIFAVILLVQRGV